MSSALSSLPPKVQKFFTTMRKGENFELKTELNSEYRENRKEAVKRVIANMTVGKDVSGLFADVLKCMQTEDLELKKLVYLYLMNYAKTQPELVILAVNSFLKDVEDPNPLIRALAIRTMGCLRAEKIINYLCDPLKKCLKDTDPYVRKTAAICVAKLYDLAPTLAVDNGFVATLQDMLGDPNPMVVANVVAALTEIKESSYKKDVFVINTGILNKLLAALNECTEWGQISILESLAEYKPADTAEARNICERVLPRLQHANASVVLSAVRVLLIYMDLINSDELQKQIVKKLAPPLVTLLSSSSELTYVALRNINLILQKRNDVLSSEMRVFFCKYNDPPYVKMEKLDVIMKLCSEKTVEQVLNELKEYANEVDVEFVRKSIRSIGLAAIKIESAAERCINVLLDLIKTKVNYVVQEAIIVIKDIFRKYPNKYEGIIPILCENLDVLDEPEAKASLIWIIGEYAERINNASELIQSFMENFKDENSQVQLQIVAAAVKCFLKKPGENQDLVQKVLQVGTQNCENPDIRDRAYIYWRLLSTNPQAAKAVVLSEKPPIESDPPTVSPTLLNNLIANISTLASVYHRPASTFLGTAGKSSSEKKAEDGNESDGDEAPTGDTVTDIPNLLDLDFSAPPPVTSSAPSSAGAVQTGNILDLLSDDIPPMQPVSAGSPVGASPLSPVGGVGPSSPLGGVGMVPVTGPAFSFPRQQLLNAAQAKGLDLFATFSRRNGVAFMDFTISNKALQPMTDFAVQFNKNSFGIVPSASLSVPTPLGQNQTIETSLPLLMQPTMQGPMQPFNLLQVAIKNNIDVFYFQLLIPIHVLFEERPDVNVFKGAWGDSSLKSANFQVNGVVGDLKGIEEKLKRNGIVGVGGNGQTMQATAKTAANVYIHMEITLANSTANVTAKSSNSDYLAVLAPSMEGILRS
ncbi:adaptin N terminal region-domain-containing protein [Paraphysoderma sedebokerense]|nr:adaptin N terminal region-domain-containing protein [Paraphysoderma sedebokerense]